MEPDKKTEINTKTKEGRFINCPGPGRPKGSKNKFTLIKEEMAEVWAEEMGKEKFRQFFNKSFHRALKEIVAILPREPLVNVDQSEHKHFVNVYIPEQYAANNQLVPPSGGANEIPSV